MVVPPLTIVSSLQNLMMHIKFMVDRQRTASGEAVDVYGPDIQEYIYDHEFMLRITHPIGMEMLSYMDVDAKRDMYAQVDEHGGQTITEDYLKPM